MPPDGRRPARAWDEIVAPPTPADSPVSRPAPASSNGAAAAHTNGGPAPVPPPPPPGTTQPMGPVPPVTAAAPVATNGSSAPLTAAPPPVGLAGAPLAAAPATAPTHVPAPLPPPPGPERTNGHLRAAPVPLADPDLEPTPAPAPFRRRPERARPAAAPSWATRRRRRKMRARKVKRQIRHIDAWSVLKLSLLFYLVLYLVVLVASVLLWRAAASTGLIDNVESFVEELFGFETFQFEPNQMLRASALIGLVMVLAGTIMNVLMAVLFNLISDLTGGIRVTVIEEERGRPLV